MIGGTSVVRDGLFSGGKKNDDNSRCAGFFGTIMLMVLLPSKA